MNNGHDDDFKRKEKQLWLEDLGKYSFLAIMMDDALFHCSILF